MVEWESLLNEAAERVQKITRTLSKSGEGSTKLSEGAGGDRTMLVDRETEDACIDVFSGVSDARIVTEERGELGSAKARWTVVIDPLDGSSNFERRLPFFCTSIGVADGGRLQDVKFGIVRNLLSGETYYAERGESRKDGRPIRSSMQKELRDAAFAIDMCRSPASEVVRIAGLVSSVKRQVHFGANALEICLVAEGKLDGFVDIRGRMRITDFAAGFLIAREAGARITERDGSALNPGLNLTERFRVVAAGNRMLHTKVLGLIGSQENSR